MSIAEDTGPYKTSFYKAILAYDIAADDYWLYYQGKRLLLRGMVCRINGLVNGQPLSELSDFEKRGLEDMENG